mmetsp:Transcript_13532/g.31964  ORF Transcript_13532/g.31964 Transcript_13532/m.31964 type:complete len:94 (+) Transcript_13532:348-629(+)
MTCSEALGGLMGLGDALGEEWALPEGEQREPLPETERPFIAVLIAEAGGEEDCGLRLWASPSRHMRFSMSPRKFCCGPMTEPGLHRRSQPMSS